MAHSAPLSWTIGSVALVGDKRSCARDVTEPAVDVEACAVQRYPRNAGIVTHLSIARSLGGRTMFEVCGLS